MTQKEMRQIAVYARDRIKARIRENRVKPSTPKAKGTSLVGSGRLMRSITYRINGNTILIGTNVTYARIHHEGGIIRPVRAKYLAIPLAPIAKVKKPREFDNTFIRNGIIYQTQEDGGILALYKLRKSVTIPARPYMFLDQKEQQEVKNRVANFIAKEFISGTQKRN